MSPLRLHPLLRRPLIWALKLLWLLLVLGLIAAIGGVLLLAETDEVQRREEGVFFEEREGRIHTFDPGLARQSWEVEKPEGALRVFLFGGSQAFGSPYVHRDQLATSRLLRWLEVPNRGGIATWLEAYLQHLFPDRPVQVVNLAMPGTPISMVHQLVPGVLEAGSPDALLILSGNNEGAVFGAEDFLVGDEFDAFVSRTVEEYEQHLDAILAAAGAAEVPVWLLTVPTNLRDHVPTDRPLFDLPAALAEAEAGECERLEARIAGAGEDHATALFLRARCLDRSGSPAEALSFYERALEEDKVIQRARPALNRLLRQREGRPGVRVLDLEAHLRRVAPDGIPGDELFIDSCHLHLRGYRLLALRIARAFGEALGAPPERIAALPALEVEIFSEGQLSRLHTVKRLKWLRLKLLTTAGSVEWINRDRYLRNFEEASWDANDFSFALDRLEADLPDVREEALTAP
ncbi:MAG: hypothetical protein P1V51_15250 [Deltaproteobacteria bacterium]|nr:hypothetical protein [Deltaproteobacteria bacterium]